METEPVRTDTLVKAEETIAVISNLQDYWFCILILRKKKLPFEYRLVQLSFFPLNTKNKSLNSSSYLLNFFVVRTTFLTTGMDFIFGQPTELFSTFSWQFSKMTPRICQQEGLYENRKKYVQGFYPLLHSTSLGKEHLDSRVSDPPVDGTLVSSPPTCQLVVCAVCFSCLSGLPWAPAVDTALLVHISRAPAPRRQLQVRFILPRSKQVSEPSWAVAAGAGFPCVCV